MSVARPRAGALGWAALLVLGQAATLAMIRAGTAVGYQHYIPAWQLPGAAPRWALAILLLEVLLVARAAWGHRDAIGRTIAGVGRWRLALIALVCVGSSATLSRQPLVFGGELVLASAIQLVHLGALLCFAAALSPSASARAASLADRLLGPGGDTPTPGGPDRIDWMLAAWVIVVAALLAVLSYQRHPHVPDEVSYILQARYFAHGMLAMPAPPVRDAFDLNLMTYEATRWFSPFPLGWPAILAVGAAAGVAWLVNPLLGGAAILLAGTFLREVYPRRVARLATVLLATSPWVLFMAMNLMSHTASLVAALAAALAVARLRRAHAPWLAIPGGIAIGIVGLIRPLEGMVVAGMLGLWALVTPARRLRLAPAAVLTITTALTAAITLPYNRALSGDARTFPVMQYMNATFGPGANDLGFGPNRGSGWAGLDPLPGHGPIDVLINADFNLFQINTELHGWAVGSLLLATLLVGLGWRRRGDGLMLAAIGAVMAVHALYYFSGGPDFGARYWYLTVVPLAALTARGALELAARHASGPARGRVPAALALLVTVALIVFVPWRAVDKYRDYRGMTPAARALVHDPALRDALVLVRGHRHPDYASAAVYNPIDLHEEGVPVFAWDRGPESRTRLVAAYPARRFWIVDGPSLTGGGYRVVAGPLDATGLLARRDSVIE